MLPLFVFLIAIVISLTLYIIIYFYSQHIIHKNYWRKRQVITSKRTINMYGYDQTPISVIAKKIYDEHPDEPYVGTFVDGKPALVIRDITNVNSVLASDFQNFYKRGFVFNKNDVLADNILFTDEYPRWKIMRQKFSPLFTSFKVKNMFALIDNSAKNFVDFVEKRQDEVTKEPYKLVTAYATAAIAAYSYGVDILDRSTVNTKLVTAIMKSLRRNFYQITKYIMADHFPTLFKLLKLTIHDESRDYILDFVKKCLKHREENNINRHDFLGMYLELKKAGSLYDDKTGYKLDITNELIAAQTFFVFNAAGDSSTNVLNFVFFELSLNKDILQKVHNEIDKMFDKNNEQITFEDYEQLNYIQMVISETMRKYPPIGVMKRKCTNNTRLPLGDLEIEKGLLVMIPTFGIHNDEQFYENPDIFDPERYSKQNMHNIVHKPNYAFGGGNRSCLGIKFARAQMCMGIARLLRRFTLEPPQKVSKIYEYSVFSVSIPDIGYKIVPRNISSSRMGT